MTKMLNKLFAIMLIFGLFVMAGAEVEACGYDGKKYYQCLGGWCERK